jgi:Phosphotransferase enzyme family
VSGWAVGHRTVTAFNGHELEVISHNGHPVLVKRFRSGTPGGKRELWARALLETHECRLAPPLHWTRIDGDRIELAMDLLRPDEIALGAAPSSVIQALGIELGRLHARCRLPSAVAGNRVAQQWLLDKARLIAETRCWAGFAGIDVEVFVRDLDAISRSVPVSLIHRDLTQDNILIQRGRPWVIDWEVSTIGQPDLDLARLRLSLTGSGIEALHEGYREGWTETAPWCARRFSSANLRLFRLLFCAEMQAHLEATGQADGPYAEEILRLAQAEL